MLLANDVHSNARLRSELSIGTPPIDLQQFHFLLHSGHMFICFFGNPLSRFTFTTSVCSMAVPVFCDIFAVCHRLNYFHIVLPPPLATIPGNATRTNALL